MGLGIGLGVGLGDGSAANPNYLLWSEELDRAATWAITGAGSGVVANAGLDADGAMTAEEVTLNSLGNLQQVTAVVAVAGSAVALKTPTSTRTRHSVSASIDGVTWIFSAFLEDPLDAGLPVQMGVLVSGGFIACRFRDTGDHPVFLASWCKLESPTLTAYVKRGGT